MTGHICPRCGANLTDGYCEYCGWNSPKAIQDKTLTLSGLLCNLTVTKETCTFNPKVGSPSVIVNKEISQVSLLQAPVVGTGELSLLAVTGITQKVTFLYPQNPKMGEIASYLLHVAPDAKFTRVEPKEQPKTPKEIPINIAGIRCPKCQSMNTTMTGKSRKFSVWKILLGIMLISIGIRVTSGGIVPQILLIVGGIALTANGLRLIGKKKLDCFCMNCRKRFRV